MLNLIFLFIFRILHLIHRRLICHVYMMVVDPKKAGRQENQRVLINMY